MPRLCSFGCAPSGASMHTFPDPKKFPERFKLWVALVGGRLETSSDFEKFHKKKVCDRHFTDKDRNRNNRLNALAVPSLHLLGASSSTATVTVKDTVKVNTSGLGTVSVTPVNTSDSVHCMTFLENNQEVASCSSVIIKDAAPVNISSGDINYIVQNKTLLKTQVASNSTATVVPFVDDTHINVDQNQPRNNKTRTNEQVSSNRQAALVMTEHNYSAASHHRNSSAKPPAFKCKQLQHMHMRSKIRNLQSEICRLRKKGNMFQTRLKNAEKLASDAAFQHVTKNMSKPSQLFVHMQLQTGKKPKGRRFSIEEKILALSLYKKSPKCYTLLHKYFILPSTKAMKRLLSQIKLTPGINPVIFEKIKKGLEEKDVGDRLCSLMFDEMSITPQIFYNSPKDKLEGFANNNESMFADHVLVFMVKGIKKNFKQPIAYYFTNGLKKLELKNLIRTVITHAQNCGLVVASTVCDQCAVNVGAINDLISDAKATYLRLKKEWTQDFFIVNGRKVIPLYDAPHLIKGIRNNLLNKDMVYVCDGKQYLVKWEYFQQVYAADKSYGELRLLNKITEEHMNPEKINKMRVKLATQIFSHSVAVVTEHLCGRGDLPEDCKQIIKITLMLDNLFDTLNVYSLNIPNGKIYKGPIKAKSSHHQMWSKAKEILKSVKFIEKNVSNDKVRFIEKSVPSVTNLIKTIEGMEALWKLLSRKYGFDAMLTRNFNQDPIENFFGNIRSYGARNIAPNTIAFEGAFKSLLLNKFNTAHSNKANCEEDNSKCLENLDFFLKEKQVTTSSDVPIEDEEIQLNEELLNPPTEVPDPGQRMYVCGWVLRKCLRNVVKTCQHCRRILCLKDLINQNEYPSKELEKCFHDLQVIIISFLQKDVPKVNLRSKIILISDTLVYYPFDCQKHKEQLKKYFVNLVINIIINSWCRSINRILSGKIDYQGEDEIKMYAKNYYMKKKHYKNKK